MWRTDMGTGSTNKAAPSRGRSTLKDLRDRGFFTYIGKNLLLILSVYALVVFIVFLVGKYLVDFDTLLQNLLQG